MQADPKTRQMIWANVRAAITTAIPTAHDASEDAEAVSDKKMPAFVVDIIQEDAEPTGMGSTELQVTDQVTVSIWDMGGKGIRQTLSNHIAAIDAQVQAKGSPVQSAVRNITRNGHEFEIDKGERRVGRVDLDYSVEYTAPLAGGDGGGFTAGFGPSFDQ